MEFIVEQNTEFHKRSGELRSLLQQNHSLADAFQARKQHA